MSSVFMWTATGGTIDGPVEDVDGASSGLEEEEGETVWGGGETEVEVSATSDTEVGYSEENS